MISPQSRTKEWILGIREKLNRKDPVLIEKMIMALSLAENLRLAGLNFIFKGGTSLFMLLEVPKRFSIDIDIVIPESNDLEFYFQEVISQGIFVRVEENIRPGSLPKQHFKFIFESVIEQKESYILLDILNQENLYPKLVLVDLQSPILLLDGEATQVYCPSKESILGDKMTTFAPHTIGIPYGIGKELEIAKQLYDIGNLFDVIDELETVRNSFQLTAKKELEYRNLEYLTPQDVLWDIFNTSIVVGVRKGASNEYTELVQGIKKLSGYIYSGFFSLDSGIVCASKIAYLSSLLLQKLNQFIHFQNTIEISDYQIINPSYQKINKLKKTNPEAFYYFYQALTLLGLDY